MPSKRNQIKTFRYSSAFQALLAGISTNESAALRALALIGADAIGQDLSTVLPDVRQTVGADLPFEIHTALQQFYQRVAKNAPASLTVQDTHQPTAAAPVPLSSQEVDRENKDPQAGAAIPDNQHSQSPVRDDDPLADLGVEYG